jgi:hypothetical protein
MGEKYFDQRPGKRALVRDDAGYETSLIDVTETAIERPKKSNAATTGARKKSTRSKAKSS